MPKPKDFSAGVAELTQHGWKVVESTAGSTTLSLPLSAKDRAEMKGANANPGFLSAGTATFSSSLFGISIAKPAAADSAGSKAPKK